MGVTIFYGGRLDLDRMEDLEDRAVDFALAVGGDGRTFRSRGANGRVVRGAVLDLAPGLDSLSLLVTPEGWLIPLCELGAAEAGPLPGRPTSWVKTPYGGARGHVLVVSVLRALKAHYCPDLEVRDDAGYWDDRDLARLRRRLSPAVAHGPLVVEVRAIEAAVTRSFALPLEHPPVQLGGSEAEWDAWHRQHLRTLTRLGRSVDERVERGVEYGVALVEALDAEGISPLPDEVDESVAVDVLGLPEDDLGLPVHDEPEPWRESVESPWEDGAEPPALEWIPHPFIERAKELVGNLLGLSDDRAFVHDPLGPAARGILELMGGTVQAFCHADPLERDQGLRILQLKRALRGAAYARGGLIAVMGEGLVDGVAAQRVVGEIDGLTVDLEGALAEARGRG